MPHLSGQEVLAAIKEKRPQVPVIVCTANSEIETAVECLKLGAHDYLVKPISFNTFGSALRNALEIGYLRQEVLSLKGLSFGAGASRHPAFAADRHAQLRPWKGSSATSRTIAASRQPALILGETGCGKELLARAIHEVSGVAGRVRRRRRLRPRRHPVRRHPLRPPQRGLHRRQRRPLGASGAGGRREPSSSTRSATSPRSPRSSCCACCRRGSTTPWGPTPPSSAGRGWWRPLTSSWRGPWGPKGAFAATSTTGSTPT